MQVVILCGGRGTRLSEETQARPKPMVDIGGRPILWHVMKIYERCGFADFTLALGYKGGHIKDYFLNYHARQSDLTLSLKSGRRDYHKLPSEDWRVSLIDTGVNTQTGGRLLRLKQHLGTEGPFMLTYGDGVADVDIGASLDFHRTHRRLATVTAVRPSSRFGALQVDEGKVVAFSEKPQSGEGWINGGFFIFEPTIFDYLKDDNTILERSPLESLAAAGELMAYQHPGYWQCMDTIRDRDALRAAWEAGFPPWLKTRQ